MASSIPPFGYGVTSAFPLLAPEGADALPNPMEVIMSISMVSSPLLLKTFLAITSSIVVDILFTVLVGFSPSGLVCFFVKFENFI